MPIVDVILKLDQSTCTQSSHFSVVWIGKKWYKLTGDEPVEKQPKHEPNYSNTHILSEKMPHTQNEMESFLNFSNRTF